MLLYGGGGGGGVSLPYGTSLVLKSAIWVRVETGGGQEIYYL